MNGLSQALHFVRYVFRRGASETQNETLSPLWTKKARRQWPQPEFAARRSLRYLHVLQPAGKLRNQVQARVSSDHLDPPVKLFLKSFN